MRVYQLTEDALRSFWPQASDEVIKGTVAAWPDVASHYGFNSIQRCAHFWGQITWECGGGTELRENLSYSAGRIVEIFGVGRHSAAVTAAEARDLAHHPFALAERVYGLGNLHMAKELGNTQHGDGYNFRGFGALNSTGRDAAVKIGASIGKDLVGNPDLCNDPGISLWSGADEYVNSLGCFKFADRDDSIGETKRINGGMNGLSDRLQIIAKWRDYFAKADTRDVVPVGPIVAATPTPVQTTVITVKSVPIPATGAAVITAVAGAGWLSQHLEAIEIAGAIAVAVGIAFVFLKSWGSK